EEADVVEREREHARVLDVLEVSRKERDDAQAALVRLRGRHAKTLELRQAEEKLVFLRTQTDELHRMKARIESAVRAAPLVPLLDEAGRASGSAEAAAKAAGEARTRYDFARKNCESKAEALQSAEKAAEAIPAMRERVARLNQVI